MCKHPHVSYFTHLAAELVAREGENLQTLGPVLLAELLQLGVVGLGQASFGGHVDDDADLALELLHAHVLAVNVVGVEACQT